MKDEHTQDAAEKCIISLLEGSKLTEDEKVAVAIAVCGYIRDGFVETESLVSRISHLRCPYCETFHKRNECYEQMAEYMMKSAMA